MAKCFLHALKLADCSGFPEGVQKFHSELYKQLESRVSSIWNDDSVVLISFLLHPQFGGHFVDFMGQQAALKTVKRIVEWMMLLKQPNTTAMDERLMSTEMLTSVMQDNISTPIELEKELLKVVTLMRKDFPSLPCGVTAKDGVITSLDLRSSPAVIVVVANKSELVLRNFFTRSDVIRTSPLLPSVAAMAASVQPTSAASERLFSAAGLVDGQLRCKLSTDRLIRFSVAKAILKKYVTTQQHEAFIRKCIDKVLGAT
jgi:hypothetical protein